MPSPRPNPLQSIGLLLGRSAPVELCGLLRAGGRRRYDLWRLEDLGYRGVHVALHHLSGDLSLQL